jgi:hypothetical protein
VQVNKERKGPSEIRKKHLYFFKVKIEEKSKEYYSAQPRRGIHKSPAALFLFSFLLLCNPHHLDKIGKKVSEEDFLLWPKMTKNKINGLVQ